MSIVMESPVASVEPVEKFPGQREWQEQHAAKLAKGAQTHAWRVARQAGISPLPPVGEIIEQLTALGLPGDPHPDRTSLGGAAYRPSGRAKQKEAKRRGERIRFLEELRNLPLGEPLPIALTDKAIQLLKRRGKGTPVSIDQINSELQLAASIENQGGCHE